MLWIQLPLELFREDFWGSTSALVMQMPHEWVKWRDKRVRTRQQPCRIARHSSSSEALPLSNVTLMLHGRTKQQVLYGLFLLLL